MALSKDVKIRVSAETASASAQLNKAADSAKRLQSSAEKASSGVSDLGSKMSLLKGAVLPAAAGIAAMVYATDKAIARSHRLTNVKKNLAFSIGSARKELSGMVSEMDLMIAANKASTLGVTKSEKEFAKLSKAAVALGASMGQDAAQSLNDLIEGLGKGSPEVLNNIGIIVKADVAYRKYAESVGKSVNELNDEEKQTARMLEGKEQLLQKSKDLNYQVDETTKAWNESKQSLINFTDGAVKFAIDGFVGLQDAISDTLATITGLNLELMKLDGLNGGRTRTRGKPRFVGESQKSANDRAAARAAERKRLEDFEPSGPSLEQMGPAPKRQGRSSGGGRAERIRREREALMEKQKANELERAHWNAEVQHAERMREIEAGGLDPISRIEKEAESSLQLIDAKMSLTEQIEDEFAREMEREQLREERTQVMHEAKLARLDEEVRIKEEAEARMVESLERYRKAEAAAAKAAAEAAKKREAVFMHAGGIVADVAAGMATSIFQMVDGTEKPFGKLVAEFSKSLARLLTVESIRYGIQSAAAFAALNPVQGAAYLQASLISAGGAATVRGLGAIAGAAAGSSSSRSSSSRGFSSAGLPGGQASQGTSSGTSPTSGSGNSVPLSPASRGEPRDSNSAASTRAPGASSGGSVTVNATVLGANAEQVGMALKQVIDRAERTGGRV